MSTVSCTVNFSFAQFIFSDPIPYIDEIIMYASIMKKIINMVNVIDRIEEHPKIAIIIGSVLLIIIIVLLVIWI